MALSGNPDRLSSLTGYAQNAIAHLDRLARGVELIGTHAALIAKIERLLEARVSRSLDEAAL
jgi:hypothetical protein